MASRSPENETIFRDLRFHGSDEELRQRLGLLENLARVEAALRSSADLDKGLTAVLEVIWSVLDCDRAWLVFPCDPEVKDARVLYEVVRPGFAGALAQNRPVPMTEDLSRMVVEALATNELMVLDPASDRTLTDVAKQAGVQSEMSQILRPSVGKPWALGVHQCSRARVWTAAEQEFLTHVARRLTDSLSLLLHVRELRESEEKLRVITESAQDSIFIKDTERRYTFVNPAMARLLGCSASDLIGRTAREVFGDVSEDVIADVDEPVLKGETVDAVRTLDVMGTAVTFHTVQVPLKNAAGAVTGICGIVRDVTAQRRAEEELRAARDELEQRVIERTTQLSERVAEAERLNAAMAKLLGDLRSANRNLEATQRQLEAANEELEAFTYSVSHDLRAPLRAINGFSSVLTERCADQLDEEDRDYLDRIGEASRNMGQLIDDLLRLSRIGRQGMTFARVSLSDVAESVAGDLRRQAPDRDVQVLITPGLEADGDLPLLRVALENLFSNAWKFTRGRSPATIEFGRIEDGVADSDSDESTTFFIRDNGAGFDMSYADKLFGPFQRLHSLSEFEGTGVGLATVQRIVQRHAGRIWAEGEVDRGATFFFTLGEAP